MLFQKRSKVIGLIFLGLSFTFSNSLFGQGFSDVSSDVGVTLVHDGAAVNDFYMGTGAAWLDFDNDGDLDLYVTMRNGANKLFQNDGFDPNISDFSFQDVAVSLGVADASGDGGGVSIADFNNDGWNDIFLANCQGNRLLKNNGGTGFTDIILTAFLDGTAGGNSRSPTASWGDYDGDGFLDLYIAQHSPPSYNQTEGTTKDFFYHNNGDETFTDVSTLLGQTNLTSWGFIGGWTDYDKDGDMDIFLVNDCLNTPSGLPTKVFRNDGGTDPLTWNFVEVGVSIGVDDCRNGMGIAVGDYDRDGWMDVFYTNIGSCVLFKNTNGVFSDISTTAGITGQNANYFSWGSAFLDYDLDGWQDIMVAIGTLSSFGSDPQPNMLFHNNTDGTFTDMAITLNMDDDRRSRSAIYGDYDNDGDLDIYVTNYAQDCVLNRNNNMNGNHWFKVKLIGSQSNKNGLGSKLKLTTSDGTIQYYETKSGSNLGGGDSPYAHFGLDTNTIITELEIIWLSGEIQIINNLSVDQLYEVTEPLAPLPVELTSFTARQENEKVNLQWTTASEIDNEYFMIQRSSDGETFFDLEKIQGRGTNTLNTNYQTHDLEPLHGDNYYRLKQVDFDEKFTFSEIQLVHFEGEKTTINVFPNPTKTGKINLNFFNNNRNTTIEIRDILGRLVSQQKVESIGNQMIEIPTSSWTNGIFVIQVSNAIMKENIKIVIDN